MDLDTADIEAGHTIDIPVLGLWRGLSPEESPLETWRKWAPQVEGSALEAGHFLAEEVPEETLAKLRAFFKPS